MSIEQALPSRAHINNISQSFISTTDISRVSIAQSLPSRGLVGYSLERSFRSRSCVGNGFESRMSSRLSVTIPISTTFSSRSAIHSHAFGLIFFSVPIVSNSLISRAEIGIPSPETRFMSRAEVANINTTFRSRTGVNPS